MRRKRGDGCIGISSLPWVCTGEVSDVLNEELVRVVYQLLGVSHPGLRWHMTFKALTVYALVLSPPPHGQGPEFTGTSDIQLLSDGTQLPVSGWR